MLTRTISEVSIENPDYTESFYLTIDFDWAHDEVLRNTLDLLEESNVKCTFFVTHDTPILARIRNNPNFELGIHPNLNPLLHELNAGPSSTKDRFEDLLRIVPEAQSFRCHSMVNSSKILEIAAELGLKFDCNYFVPYQANIDLKPWYIWNGIIRVPYFWEDDISLAYGQNESPEEMVQILASPGIKVFDFHPIHIILNTEQLARYENSRLSHYKPDSIMDAVNTGYGTRNKLQSLLKNA